MLGTQLVVLFWEVVKILGGKAKLKEVDHWGCTFECYI
jgi:hypothetical protein